jgi:hypothetical protein
LSATYQSGAPGSNQWHPPIEFTPGAQAYLHQQEPIARASVGNKQLYVCVCPKGDEKQIQSLNLTQIKQWISKHKEMHIHQDWIRYQASKGLDKYGNPRNRPGAAPAQRQQPRGGFTRPRGIFG